jgi:hypothetical protein
MPMAPPRACDTPGCPSKALPGTWLCETHKAQSQKRHNQQSADRRKKLTPAYESKFRPALISAGNVLCQRVITEHGQRIRCTERAEICHHLLGTDEYPQHVTNWLNAVMVCRPHNPNLGGDPGGLEYIPTQWSSSLGGDPPVHVAPGERIPEGTPLWTLATQRKRILG